MAAAKVPYPPSPTNVPEGLTDYPSSYVRQQNKLLAGLFVFLIFYITMVVFFAMLGTWCALTFAKWPLVKAIGIAVCVTFFLFLVKGFLKGRQIDKEKNIEITADDHPLLFQFIEKLCDELGAPLPERVFVSADVNAACVRRLSLINLFVEPKQELLIGLGLVNCMNLSEFKGVLAHEFGHFCQSGQVNSYSMVVQGIMWDMVRGEDWFDRIINWMRQRPLLSGANNIGTIFWLFAVVIGFLLDLGRKFLGWLLNLFALQSMALSREREFHADKVAVSAVGSDNATHMLLRVGFGMQCFMQALNDLVPPARDHKVYTNDLYLHQSHAAEFVRRTKKDVHLGLPPQLGASTGQSVRVFDAEQEEMEDEDSTPPMWRSHPRDADREENIKKEFVPAPMDHRSAWILFSNPAELKERMTYKFYRSAFGMKKNTELTDARKVQEYIDNERAETTYDAKYHGAYDERILEPGDLIELDTLIRNSPWPEERMLKVYDKLYDGCREHAEEHNEGFKELQSLRGNVIGKPSPKMKKLIKEAEEKLEKNREWFKSFDRRVYLLHIQMAAAVDEQMKDELIERYRFQMEVQRFYQVARDNYNDADMYLSAYAAASRGEIQVPNDFPAQVIAVLRTAWKALKKIIQDAREINLPAMKNFEEGERLADFILDGKLVPEPPLSEVKGVWVQKLMDQLLRVKNRCLRLHFKSLGGVLAMQEKIAAAWLAERRPEALPVVEAEVEAVEVIAAEVVPEPADALPAEPVQPSSPHQPQTGGAPIAALVSATPASLPAEPADLRSSPFAVAPPEDAAPIPTIVLPPEPEPEAVARPVAEDPWGAEPLPASTATIPPPPDPAPLAAPTLAIPPEPDPLEPVFLIPSEPEARPDGATHPANSEAPKPLTSNPEPAILITEQPSPVATDSQLPMDLAASGQSPGHEPAPSAPEPETADDPCASEPLAASALRTSESVTPKHEDTPAATPAAQVSTTDAPEMPKPRPEPLPLDDDDEPRPQRPNRSQRGASPPARPAQPLPLDDEPMEVLPLDDEPVARGPAKTEDPILDAEVIEAEIFPVEDEIEPYPMAPAKQPRSGERPSPFEQKAKPAAAQRPVEPMPILAAEVVDVVETVPPPKSSVLIAEVVTVPTPVKPGSVSIPPKPKSRKQLWGSAPPTAGEGPTAPSDPVRECLPRARPERPPIKITMVRPGQKSPFAKV
jgi:Zn-dependent protease with chaperone function